MKNFIFVSFVAFSLAACGSSIHTATTGVDSNTEEEAAASSSPTDLDGEQALAVLPVLESVQSLVSNQDSNSQNSSLIKFTIGPYNASELPATPDAMFNDTTYQTSNGYARYPATGYLNNFYGEEGNQAYMELRQISDGWGEYQVKLYVYPTTSQAVRYTLETYRVNGDSWYNLIDQSGEFTAIDFEEIKTDYFDTRTETRTLSDSRYVEGKVNRESDFTMPEDFNNSAYSYSDYQSPEKIDAPDINGEDYSSNSTYTINQTRTDCPAEGESSRLYYCISESGQEDYLESTTTSGDKNVFSQAKSRRTIKYLKGSLKDLEITANTVRRYTIDTDGKKIVRAKTVQDYELNNRSYSTTITEEHTTQDADNNGLSEVRIITNTSSESSINRNVYTYNYNYDIDLEETSDNVYEGSYTITYDYNRTSRSYCYNARLDINGLRLTRAQSCQSSSSLIKLAEADSTAAYDLGDKDHFDAESETTSLSIDLVNGKLSGATLQGGLLLDGKFGDEEIDVMIGPGFMILSE